MDKKELIELTNKLYKLTLFFPKKEPLRYRIRETADEILENFITWEVFHSSPHNSRDQFLIISEIKKDLEVIAVYFEIIKWQNWVSYFDILKIKDEYDKIKDSLIIKETIIEKPKSLKEPQVAKKELSFLKKELGERQKKILEILKEKEMVQVWEVNKILSDVSKRTLRRDFEQLLKQGFVNRVGEKSKTFYKLAP